MALPLNYHWRNLFARKTTTLLTVLVVAAVVGTFVWVQGFAQALSRSLSVASDPRNVIVIQRGSISETNSVLTPEDFNKLTQLADVARDANGAALVSPEMMVQVSLGRKRDNAATQANVAVRGVTDVALQVHQNVRLLGQKFSLGEPQVIVGKKASEQFRGVNVGDRIRLGSSGNREFTVVGQFTGDGAPIESEIWGYLPALQSAFNRNLYSSATLRLREGADPAATTAALAGPAIQLEGQTERQYWAAQAQNVWFYYDMCAALVIVMCLAAVFSIANTMFATVAGRTREIAMLRTIGYGPGSVLMGFVIEAVLLSLLAGAIGCVGCWAYLALVGNTKDMFGANTFTTMAFEIRITPTIVAMVLAGSALVGALGAFFPARRAASLPVISALREA